VEGFPIYKAGGFNRTGKFCRQEGWRGREGAGKGEEGATEKKKGKRHELTTPPPRHSKSKPQTRVRWGTLVTWRGLGEDSSAVKPSCRRVGRHKGLRNSKEPAWAKGERWARKGVTSDKSARKRRFRKPLSLKRVWIPLVSRPTKTKNSGSGERGVQKSIAVPTGTSVQNKRLTAKNFSIHSKVR